MPPNVVFQIHPYTVPTHLVIPGKLRANKYAKMTHNAITCPLSCQQVKKILTITGANVHVTHPTNVQHRASLTDQQFVRTADLFLCWITTTGRILYAIFQHCCCGSRFEIRHGHPECKIPTNLRRWSIGNEHLSMPQLVLPQYMRSSAYVPIHFKHDLNYVENLKRYLQDQPELANLVPYLEFVDSETLESVRYRKKIYSFGSFDGEMLYEGYNISCIISRFARHSISRISDIASLISSGRFNMTVLITMPDTFIERQLKIIEKHANIFLSGYCFNNNIRCLNSII